MRAGEKLVWKFLATLFVGNQSAGRDYRDHGDFGAKMAKIGQQAGPGIGEKFK